MTIQTRTVLSALRAMQPGEQMWGHRLRKETGLSSGAVYQILGRLADRGLVSIREEPQAGVYGRPVRRFCELTQAGRELAARMAPAQDDAGPEHADAGGEFLIRSKGLLDGSVSIREAAAKAADFAAYMHRLAGEGYVLTQSAEDDYAFVRKP